MNSIDDAELEAAIGPLFDQVLLPMSDRMRAQGLHAFPMQPDVSWLSYYVRRRRSAMTHADFDSVSCADIGELQLRIAALWTGLGRTELALHAGQVGQAAAAARAALAGRTAQVALSPSVYAMF